MPHVCFVPLTGFRVREAEMAALGMALPGLRDRAAAIGALPALGVLTLAGMTPDRWSISLHEAPSVTEQLVQEILAQRPTLVAVSALTASVMDAYHLARLLRAEGVRTVIGGLHATAMPEEASQWFDAVVVGDGESTWHQVLGDAERGTLQKFYKPGAPFDMARSPMPRFDLLSTTRRTRYTLQTQRGCPLACDFCAASRLLGPFREKPADRIAAELHEITQLHPRPVIELADDNTFAGRRDHTELLRVLGDSGVRWFTEGDWRLGEKPEAVDRLGEAGCVQVLVGIESMVHRHQGMGAKSTLQNRMVESIERIQERGVAVIACAIVGSDGEDHESIEALMDFLLRAPFADVQLTMLTPFPGTALRARLEREGRLLADRDWSSHTLFDLTYQPDRLSVDQMERAFRTLVQSVFGAHPAARREAIRRDVWSRNKSFTA